MKSLNLRSHLLLAASAIAMLAACPAHAQSTAPQAGSPPAPGGEAKATTGLEEIVVTAQKSTENLQKTAAAVTAVAGATLVKRGVVNLQDAQMVVPAARFQKEGNNTQVFVRGVGQNLDFPHMDPTVAFNFNGVYMPREATSAAFFDLASLEVLPGPQGTLYGRGALGGTVNVQFKRPGFDNKGTAVVEGGNYALFHATATQDLSNSDQLALRLALDYDRHDGYFTSGADAADNIAGRISGLYKPSDKFSAYVWVFGAENNGKTPNIVNHDDKGGPFDFHSGFLTSNPYDDVGASNLGRAIVAGFGLPFTLGTARAENTNYQVVSAGGEFAWKFNDQMNLTYIPGYTRLRSAPLFWFGPMLFKNTADLESHSHELRLAGDTGSVKWLLGAFYYYQDYTGSFTNFFGGPQNPSPFIEYAVDIRKNFLRGEGAFGQATWSATKALRITLGGRYSHDSRDAGGTNPEYRPQGAAPGTGTGFGLSTPDWTFRKTYDSIDWKAALEYDLLPRVMGYVSAQTSHAPGSFNFISQEAINAGDPFVNPGKPYDGKTDVKKAKLTAFAGGIKSRILDNTLQINIEGFYYTYSNLVMQQFDATKLFNPVFNAKEVDIYGMQADLVWRPTTADNFSVDVAWTHARNKDFVTPSGISYNGLQPPYSPDWTTLASYTHTFDLGNLATLDATISGRYESSWFATFTHGPGTKQEASGKIDASLTYDSGKNWQFTLWGKNLTDNIVMAANGSGGFPGPATGYLEAPRTYGVRLSLQY